MWQYISILKIERVENGMQEDGSAEPYYKAGQLPHLTVFSNQLGLCTGFAEGDRKSGCSLAGLRPVNLGRSLNPLLLHERVNARRYVPFALICYMLLQTTN